MLLGLRLSKMYITKKFIYLHVPKTGGQTMLRMLDRFKFLFRGRGRGFHRSVASVRPEMLEGKHKYALVRNPWDWYTSWYYFLKETPGLHNVLFNTISNKGKYGFKRSINNLFDMLEGNEDITDKFNTSIVNAPLRRPLQVSGDDIDRIGSWGCGLQSYYYHYLVFGEEAIEDHDYTNVTIGKQESSRVDTLAFMKSLDIENARLTKTITNHRRLNQTKFDYGKYQDQYDDKLKKRVAEKEQYIIEKYGYTF